MIHYLLILLFYSMQTPFQLVDFKTGSDLDSWRIIDDVVMGGRSNSKIEISDDGHAVFHGQVSLENNGGFASARCQFDKIQVKTFDSVLIKLKGDKKRYQFRVKSDRYDRHSYIAYFETSGDWQTIELSLSNMYPSFRGMRLNMPNFPGETMEEIAFLIGNKQAESFKLEIASISLK